MKKIIIMVSAAIFAATMNANPVNTEPFSKVNVNVPGRIRLIKGESYGVSVYAADHKYSSSVEFTVKNGVLSIETSSDDMRQSSGKGTVITVITPKEDTMLTSGNDVYKATQTKIAANAK